MLRLVAVAVVLMAVTLFVGWNYRTARFAAELRIVEKNGGSFIQVSDWRAHATDVRIGSQTELNDISTILSLLMAGRVDKIDFSDAKFTKSDIVSLPDWANNSIKSVEWPCDSKNNAG